MTALQLDLLAPEQELRTRRRVIESPEGAWRAHYTGARWGWCLYRRTSTGWETWEPNLPFGQPYLTDRTQAEQVLLAEISRHGDRPLPL